MRLPGWDYRSPGGYFVTICTHRRKCLFGEVVDEELRLNACGEIAQEVWDNLCHHYDDIKTDAFIVMPNHIHGIIFLLDRENYDGMYVGAGFKPAPTQIPISNRHGLPEIVRGFKTFASRHINQYRGTPGSLVWQRGYDDPILRDDADLAAARAYIRTNPLAWALEEDTLLISLETMRNSPHL